MKIRAVILCCLMIGVNAAGAREVSVPITLAPGNNTITIEAQDNAGNTAVSTINLENTATSGGGSTVTGGGGIATVIINQPGTSPLGSEPQGQNLAVTMPPREVLPQPTNAPYLYQNPEMPQAPEVMRQYPSEAPYPVATTTATPVINPLPAQPAAQPHVAPPVINPPPRESVSVEATPESLELEARESKRVLLVWRNYTLKLLGVKATVISWDLAHGATLPFGLALNKKQGTLYGFAFRSIKTAVDLNVTLSDGRTLRISCPLDIR